VTEREAPPSWGFDHPQIDPYDEDGWFGGEQVAEPTYVDDVPTPPHGEPALPFVEEPHVAASDPAPAAPPPIRRASTATVNTWTVNGQLRASDTSTLTFRAPPDPWYRGKQVRLALVAVAIAAVVVPLVLLAWPDSPPTSPGPATSIAPQPSTTQPVLSSAPPTPINVPPPPLPPPPPPPPDTGTAPTYDQPYWTPSPPSPTKKPDVDVTRAPISVAPPSRQSPGTNSANPGDGRKGFHCGGWC
jgi:hypothetical protein